MKALIKPMNLRLWFVLCSCLYSGCRSATTRSLPVASAIIVHSCAVAEADAYIRGAAGGAYAITKTTISIKNTGETQASVSQVAGVEANKGAEKSTDVEISRLPSMSQCKGWGYIPQLGKQGCLLGAMLANGQVCKPIERGEYSTAYPADIPAPTSTKADTE